MGTFAAACAVLQLVDPLSLAGPRTVVSIKSGGAATSLVKADAVPTAVVRARFLFAGTAATPRGAHALAGVTTKSQTRALEHAQAHWAHLGLAGYPRERRLADALALAACTVCATLGDARDRRAVRPGVAGVTLARGRLTVAGTVTRAVVAWARSLRASRAGESRFAHTLTLDADAPVRVGAAVGTRARIADRAHPVQLRRVAAAPLRAAVWRRRRLEKAIEAFKALLAFTAIPGWAATPVTPGKSLTVRPAQVAVLAPVSRMGRATHAAPIPTLAMPRAVIQARALAAVRTGEARIARARERRG